MDLILDKYAAEADAEREGAPEPREHEHKYRLVNALHRNGEIVAVTGDGINDTLALKGGGYRYRNGH